MNWLTSRQTWSGEYMTMKLNILAIAGLASIGVGCVDVELPNTTGAGTATRSQAVTVVPRFVLVGADNLPTDLFLTELGLVVSEIRLTPIITANHGLAYASAQPTVLTFDVASGEFSQDGAPLELPERGRYVVSIRLEPVATGDGDPASLSVNGFVAESSDAANPGKVADGTPLPLPFDSKRTITEMIDAAATPVTWTPFQYQSQRAVFYTLNDVELERGEQILQFTFDLQEWATDLAAPIARAVRNTPATEADDGVDVTRQVESTGFGVDALVQTGVVSSELPR